MYDGAHIVGEYDSAGVLLAKYTQGAGIDEPLSMSQAGTIAYYGADGLGSVTSLEDGTGSVVAAYTYDSFGNLTSPEPALVNRFRYTGREWDQETSLYYYRARYYDPSIGRFLCEDPDDFAADINLYRYVYNRPTDLIDPSGLRSKKRKPKPEPKPQVPPNAAYYICCQKGAFGICEGPLARPSSMNNPLFNVWHLKCEKEHEQQHIDDFNANKFPEVPSNYCQGKPNNTPVGIPLEAQPKIECGGYTKQSQCLDSSPGALMDLDKRFVQQQCSKFCGK